VEVPGALARSWWIGNFQSMSIILRNTTTCCGLERLLRREIVFVLWRLPGAKNDRWAQLALVCHSKASLTKDHSHVLAANNLGSTDPERDAAALPTRASETPR
jgi:hypothetical protein